MESHCAVLSRLALRAEAGTSTAQRRRRLSARFGCQLTPLSEIHEPSYERQVGHTDDGSRIWPPIVECRERAQDRVRHRIEASVPVIEMEHARLVMKRGVHRIAMDRRRRLRLRNVSRIQRNADDWQSTVLK